MACIRGGNDSYCDGDYAGFCSLEKRLRYFNGIVSLTETGRIMATGPCESCGTLITNLLYTP